MGPHRQYGLALRVIFWGSSLLLAWTQAGYAVLLAALHRTHARPPRRGPIEPRVTLIVPAYREAAVIADKVRNALALDWPRERLEVVVAVDGGDPDTVREARAAGADRVLELPRGGKVRAQDAAVREAGGELLAFSDANAMWEPDALRALASAFADPGVGYACGRVRFVNAEGTNQEGLYWRYEMWLRGRESDLASVTAGNGAIYAVRPEAYFEGDPRVSHDLAFPFALVKRGWRCVDVADAHAIEKMVPTIEGEWRRKRRMMAHAWPAIATGGLADLRGYPPLYAVMIVSHRLLRYATPFLHLAALLSAGRAARSAQLAVLAAAGAPVRRRPFLIARYYVSTTAAIAAGLYDWLRHGTEPGWDPAEGTR
jgi:cellulose synthase/poly-beta-1,6-N-acetylglucosamine synthase-like glycosyltransferase